MPPGYASGERAPRGIVLVDGGITQMDDRDGETWESLSERLAPPRLEGMTVEAFMQMHAERDCRLAAG